MNAMSQNAGLTVSQGSLGLTIETLQAIVGHSPVGICVTDPDGIVEVANRAFLNLCDHPENGVLGRHITLALPPGRVLPENKDHSIGDVHDGPAELIIAVGDGHRRSILASAIHILDENGRPKILTYAFDVTQHPIIERQLELETELLERLSTHDRLTGLFNRRHADAVLAVEVGRSGRSDKPLSVAVMTVDRLRSGDEPFGDEVADEVLVGVARCLKRVIRETDTLARYEGEQFLMIMPFTVAARAMGPLRRARAELASECEPHKVTFCAGVTQYRSGETPQDFRARADRLLARAKAEGGDRIVQSGLFEDPA